MCYYVIIKKKTMNDSLSFWLFPSQAPMVGGSCLGSLDGSVHANGSWLFEKKLIKESLVWGRADSVRKCSCQLIWHGKLGVGEMLH